MYVKVGLFLGPVSITLFELRKEFNLVILGPLKLEPQPFDPIANFNEKSGELVIVRHDVTCQSKGGTVGDEVMSCWYYITDAFGEEIPIIKTFEGVKTAVVRESNPRGYTFDCILSQNDVSCASLTAIPHLLNFYVVAN